MMTSQSQNMAGSDDWPPGKIFELAMPALGIAALTVHGQFTENAQ